MCSYSKLPNQLFWGVLGGCPWWQNYFENYGERGGCCRSNKVWYCALVVFSGLSFTNFWKICKIWRKFRKFENREIGFASFSQYWWRKTLVYKCSAHHPTVQLMQDYSYEFVSMSSEWTLINIKNNKNLIKIIFSFLILLILVKIDVNITVTRTLLPPPTRCPKTTQIQIT